MAHRLSHVIGFDDGPFPPTHRGNVLLVGTVFAGLRMEGVMSGRVRRDGRNATHTIVELVTRSRFRQHAQLILLQGIAVAGFNVINLQAVYQNLQIPVVVVCRKQPNLPAIRRALLMNVPGGKRKWALIEQAGPMEPLAGVFVQRMGVSLGDTEGMIRRLAVNSVLPEPLRVAHMIAGGLVLGESRHRP